MTAYFNNGGQRSYTYLRSQLKIVKYRGSDTLPFKKRKYFDIF